MNLKDGTRLLKWPLAEHILTAGWTYNDGSAHNAIDFRAAIGTPIYAAEDGFVSWVQNWNGTKNGTQSYGNAVKITHNRYAPGNIKPKDGQKLETLYAHLSTICVYTEQIVHEGDLIGFTGVSGNCFGAHLHYEVRLNGKRVNPLYWHNGLFTCANGEVWKHLGKYKSVEV